MPTKYFWKIPWSKTIFNYPKENKKYNDKHL